MVDCWQNKLNSTFLRWSSVETYDDATVLEIHLMVAANSKGRGTYERHLSLLAKFWYYCYWYCHCQYITKKNLTNVVNHQPHCSGVYQNLGFLHHSHSFTPPVSMQRPMPEGPGPTIIAISAGRNSPHAVKWAVEHLLNKNSSCTLIHVRTKSIYPRRYPSLSMVWWAM